MKYPLEFDCTECPAKAGELCVDVSGSAFLHINRERQARRSNEVAAKKRKRTRHA